MPLLPMDNDGPLSPAIKQEEYFTTSLLYGIFYDLHSYDLHPNRMCFPDSISRLGMQLPSCCNSVMLARLTRRDPVQPHWPRDCKRCSLPTPETAEPCPQPTLTVGKPCCVRSLTEPRLPSVRYRALCWLSGCTMIFSSFPSLLVGYWPHNIGVFFPPAPFWFSDALRSQNTPSRCQMQLPSKNAPSDRKAKKAKSAY